MINKKRLTKTIRRLLQIPSENPPGDERAVAAYVARKLRRSGLAPRIFRFKARRDNVAAVLKGRRPGKGLLVTPHLDTVPAGSGWKHGSFSGMIVGGKVYGRGASDCKGNLAVAMEVFESLSEDGFVPERDVIFLATADEETGSGSGLVPILEKRVVRPAHALILDSDEFYIITSQKGLIHFTVEVTGHKAHGAYPERGVNAIEQAARMIRELKGIRWRYRPHPRLKPPTVNIGTIRGGDKVNMVADRCVFEVDLRFLPGMRAADVLREVRRALGRVSGRNRITVNDIQQPYEISEDHPLVTGLAGAAKGVVASSPVQGSEGATVITFFQRHGIPAVATGYGAKGTAHATDEYARLADLYKGAVILERFIKRFPAR